MAEVAKDHPSAFVRNYKGLAVLRSLLRPTTSVWRGPRCVVWLWGAAGTGKSRTAYSICGDALPYEPIRPGKGTVWWDGYRGEKAVLFDDIRRDQVSASDFLRWCDGRDFVGAVKGSTIGIEAHTWVFTCNYHWRYIWPDEDVTDAGPIGRRITHCIEYKIGMPLPEIKCGHGHAVEPGNTLPVQRRLVDSEAEASPQARTPARTPQELQRLLDAVDKEMFDFCDKHGLPECSACDPMWGSSLLK